MKQGLHVSYLSGAIAGLLGGIAMALVAMMATAALGMGLFAAPIMIGGIALGPAAVMGGGVEIIIVGLALHMMLSIVFGLFYALVVNAWTHEIWTTGIVLALALWIFNFYGVGAILPGAHLMAQNEPLLLAVMTHLVFGAVMAFVASRNVSRSVATAS
ncbi:MAG TPA: hypothetical protein VNF68_01945 [Candidatus Baltobacteraceae bacterium]|nr:hypothetical protein [Candidatus Baltobacteraceae bacterium]